MLPPIDSRLEKVIDTDQEQTGKFRVLKCGICNGVIQLGPGDVIFGENWYHGLCWESMESSKSK